MDLDADERAVEVTQQNHQKKYICRSVEDAGEEKKKKDIKVKVKVKVKAQIIRLPFSAPALESSIEKQADNRRISSSELERRHQ